MFKIFIKDDHDKEILEYKVEQFVSDFADAISKEKLPWFNEEKKRALFFKIAEDCIRKFKKKTIFFLE